VTKKKFEVFLDSYVKELVDFLGVHFLDICDSEDTTKMLSGLASGSEVELHAAATIESWKIILLSWTKIARKLEKPCLIPKRRRKPLSF
jgi:hypothetical protein